MRDALGSSGPRGRIAQELAEVGHFMFENGEESPARVFAYDGDEFAALRLRIDRRIERLFDDRVDDGEDDENDEDPMLGLIADLVRYRIALWDLSIDLTFDVPPDPERFVDLAAPQEYQFVAESNPQVVINLVVGTVPAEVSE